jgi:hypothetical protein
MQWYHYVIIILKLVFLIQFGIILYDKRIIDPRVYLITEILFKLTLSLYMQYLIFCIIDKSIKVEDKLFISFGSGLLAYDAMFNDTPDLLELYGVQNAQFIR